MKYLLLSLSLLIVSCSQSDQNPTFEIGQEVFALETSTYAGCEGVVKKSTVDSFLFVTDKLTHVSLSRCGRLMVNEGYVAISPDTSWAIDKKTPRISKPSTVGTKVKVIGGEYKGCEGITTLPSRTRDTRGDFVDTRRRDGHRFVGYLKCKKTKIKDIVEIEEENLVTNN